jgi:hypothetical protein
MATYAPGFINVRSRALGGEISLSIAHIIGISPTVTHRGGDTECTLILDDSTRVLVDITRDDILQAISEAAGTDRAGSGAAINKISAGIAANTQTLVAAVQQNRIQPPA